MQRVEAINSDPVAAASLPYGEMCTTTRRIVIVSPFPYSLNDLIRELTADCNDVLVFHHMDTQALTKLPADLIIIDLTKEKEAAMPAAGTLPEGVPALFLVNGDQRTTAHELTFQWPASVSTFLDHIQSVLVQHVSSIRKPSPEHHLMYKDLHVDLKRMIVSKESARLDLTKTEYDLLHALIEANGAVLSRQSLMDRVWGENYFGGSNTIDVHMKSLRQKLQDNPKCPKYIATVRGIGYRLAD